MKDEMRTPEREDADERATGGQSYKAQLAPGVAENLPKQVLQLLEVGCSWEAVSSLMKNCGGLQVRIPTDPRAGQIVTDRCGFEIAEELSKAAGGLRLNVPFGHAAIRAARAAQIKADYDAGLGIVGLVTKYQLTTNHIRAILAR